MIVPRYWAEARRRHRDKRQITVRRFGWSDESQEAADRHAAQRADEAMARLRRGELLHRRDHKVAYNGAEGLPIREEVFAEYGGVVITRNSYGALCLNVENVLIADVDFDRSHFSNGAWLVGLIVAWIPLFLVLRRMIRNTYGATMLALLGAFVISPVVLHQVSALRRRRQGGIEAITLRRIEAFVDAHPDWRLRRYRTPNGFRLIAVHRTFMPDDPQVGGFFTAIGTDPVYVRMCERQHCFRARLTPKPWRIGIEQHLRPRPGVWPIKPERMPERREWIAKYEQASVGHAACRFEQVMGNGPVDRTAEALARLHDQLSGAESGQPIA